MYSPFGTQHGHGQAHIYMVHTKYIGAAPPRVRTPDAGAFPVQWSLVRFPACPEILKVVNAVNMFVLFFCPCCANFWAISTAVLSFWRLVRCTVLIAQLCFVLGN